MSTAIVIQPDGAIVLVADCPAGPDRDDGGLLHWSYATIGCNTIDILDAGTHAGEPIDLWVDDEGLLTRQPFNFLATCLMPKGHSPLVGTAIALTRRGPESFGLETSWAQGWAEHLLFAMQKLPPSLCEAINTNLAEASTEEPILWAPRIEIPSPR